MTGATLIDAEPLIVVDKPCIANFTGPTRITTKLDMDKKLGFLRMESLLNRYFNFHQIDLNFKHKAVLASKQEKKQYGLALMSMGRDSATFGNNNKIEATAGNGIFTFNPALKEDHCFYPDIPTRVSYFEINADYFTRLLFDHDSLNGELSEVREKVTSGDFLKSSGPISVAHHRIISDINNCPLEGSLGNLMLEGSLHQLIALQLASLGAAPGENGYVSMRDKEIMYAIKDHLHATFHKDHSLIGLSQHFGINQGKLKKYFKSLFGVPVIEYVFDLKMEHARALLLDKGMYVAEVAPIVGYKNSNHFATAFKRKFGVNPSRLRA